MVLCGFPMGFLAFCSQLSTGFYSFSMVLCGFLWLDFGHFLLCLALPKGLSRYMFVFLWGAS